MCGITGFIISDGGGNVNWNNALHLMTDRLSHRGPNSDGYYYERNNNFIAGFGHRRLSIIDLSENANQPMKNEDDTVIVVFNGEIYNYKRQAEELIRAGHQFKSNSDTEVIIHLYEDYKERCLDKLDGMFAFALLDRLKNQ